MDNLDSETLQLSYTVDKKDLINGIWEVISKLKPEWLKENVQYKVGSILNRYCFTKSTEAYFLP